MANYKSWKDIARQQGIQFEEDKILDYKLPATAYINKYDTNQATLPLERTKVTTWRDIARQQGIDVEPEPSSQLENPSFFERMGRGLSSIGKTTIGSGLSNLGTLTEPVNQAIMNATGYKWSNEDRLRIANQLKLPSSLQAQNDADKILQSAAEDMRIGKQGLGPVTGLLYEGTVAAGQMAADKVLSYITGIPMIPSIGMRAFGQSASEARQEGAALGQQIGYGALSAGIEMGTEKLFGGTNLHKKLMGGGVADSAADFAMDKLAKTVKASPRVTSIMKFIGSMAEEGTEEVISEILTPIAKRIAYAPDTPDSTIEERLYAGLVGAVSAGIIGGSGQIIENRSKKQYSKMLNKEYERVMNDLPDDSPIHEKIDNIKENGAAITDDVKEWVIRLAGEDFQSETDKLLRNNQPIAQTMVNESNLGEQLDNIQESFVKTQNMASDGIMVNSNVFGIENVTNPTEVKSKVQNYYKDLISTSEISKPIMNKNTGLPVEVSRATINQTFGADEKFRIAADNDIKIAAMENIVPLIENGDMKIVDTSEKPSSKVIFATINGDVIVNGIPHAVSLEVRRTDTGNKMFVHSVKTDVGQVQLTENKKSGMINNGYENQIDPIAYSILDRIGQATGMKIKVVPQIDIRDNQGTILQANAGNGQYDPKTQTMEISMTADNPMLVVAKHEITHMLEQKAPEAHKEYKDYIINSMKKNGTYDAIYADYELRYKLMGINLFESEIQDEIVADATETFLTDKTAIDNLVRENKTLGQKILDIIREFIKKVDEAVKGVTTGWMGTEQLRVAERMWVEALNSVVETNLSKSTIKSEGIYSLKDDSQKESDSKKSDIRPRLQLPSADITPAGTMPLASTLKGSAMGRSEDRSIVPVVKDNISQNDYNVKNENKYSLKESFDEQIDKWLKGEMKSSDYFYLGMTPDVFVQNKAKKLPVTMSLDVMKKITGGKHDISIDVLRKLPESLADPILLLKSDTVPNAYVILTELQDKAGDDVIAAIHLNRFENRMRVNRISSVYGKYDIENFINQQIEKGNLLYANNKSQSWFTSRGLQLPKLVQTFIDSNNSISQNNENDNNNFEKNNNVDNTNVEGLLLENHKEYNNNKEALKLAREGIEELSKIRYSLSKERRGMGGSGINTIADGICREFIQKGYTELKGRKVNNVEDLAEIAQVFRDPRFETFRIFYIKKNKIVAHEGISSRIPGLSCAFLNIPKKSDFDNDFDYAQARKKWNETKFDDIKDRMKRLGADGYYLLHNHPSGNPTASKQDVMLTKAFSDGVSGYKGHVIINSNKYGIINLLEDHADVAVLDLKQQRLDLALRPTIQNDLLSVHIDNAEKVAEIVKALQLNNDKSIIVFADVKGNTRGIQEVPNGMIKNLDSFKGYLRNQGVYFGSGWAFLATSSNDIYRNTEQLIREKYLMDAIYTDSDGTIVSGRNSGFSQSDDYEWAGIKDDDIGAKRVNEYANEYSLKDSRGNVLSNEQRDYFKDSKVRDKDGNLQVVYHGTADSFTVFDPEMVGANYAQDAKGFFFTDNKKTAEGYANFTSYGTERSKRGKIFEVYLNIKNPLIVNVDFDPIYTWDNNHEQLLAKAEKQLKDGIIIKAKKYESMYLAFNSNQIKNVENKNPTENADIRFQLKDQSKDIERLKEVNARLKEQFKLTKGVKLDKKAVKKLSSSILKDYGSSYSRSEMESRLYNLYDKIANDTIDFEDMQAETHSIARDILENASVLDDSMHKEYAELRKTLRNTSITLPDRYKVDFNVYGGFDSFRKKNFGRMNLTNGGMGVDSFYQELSEMYPELFLKDVSNPSDQLMLMSDVLDGLMPIYENPFDRDINTAVEYLAAELFEDITVVPQAKPTFADKKKAEKKSAVDMVKFENKERIGRILEQQKIKREKAVATIKKRYEGEAYKTWWKNKLKENDIKSHYQEMIKDLRAEKNEKIKDTASRYKERIGNIYEDRKMREVKANIARRVKRLDTLLRKPTQKKHINKALEKSIAELLAQLDFSTDRQSENTVLRLRDLRAEYEKIAKVSDEEGMQANADPYIMEALEMLNGKRLADMNLDELEIMYNVVSYFDHMVNAYNKAFIGGKWEEISTKSSSILGELQTDKPVTESAYDRVQAFKDMANWGMLTPQMFFKRMGNTFTELYSDIRTSLDKKIENTKITQDYMKNLLRNVDKKTLKSWTGDKAEVKVFNIGGGKRVELTPAQVMSLYLLVKREQARGHIFGLGIKAAPVVTKDGKGVKHIKKQFEPARVTPVDVQKMVASLSKEQRKIADGIGKFLNTYSKQWVNEATLQNYGYELAKEENYFPLKADRDFLKSDFDVTSLDPTFTSMGFLKNIVKGAGNAIIIEDIFDVLTEHADKAATYNAFLTATENMKKVINFRTESQSIKQSMSKKFGLQAFRYLEKLMHDLQGGIRVESGAPIVNSMLRTTKRAVLGLNMRTVIQQPTALIRASAMINPEYLAKGIAQKSNMDEMLEHSPIAKWKSWGYFTLDTGRTMKDIILDTQPFLDKQYNFIQKADDITWTKLWNAVKLEIADTMPELKVGSRGYFEAVSKRFSDIIDETQVVDTVLHRSDLMRQRDFSWKILTNFMAEPTKSFNLLLNSIETYNSNRTTENRDRMIRTLSAYAATTLVNTFIISMVDLWRDKEGDKELIGTWIENILNEVTGLLPIVRDIYSLLEGYSIKRMEYEGIEKLARSWNRTIAYVKEIGEGDDHKYPARLIVKDWTEAVGYIAGVGVKNVNRELEAILRNYMKFTGADDGMINGVYEFMFMK